VPPSHKGEFPLLDSFIALCPCRFWAWSGFLVHEDPLFVPRNRSFLTKEVGLSGSSQMRAPASFPMCSSLSTLNENLSLARKSLGLDTPSHQETPRLSVGQPFSDEVPPPP